MSRVYPACGEATCAAEYDTAYAARQMAQTLPAAWDPAVALQKEIDRLSKKKAVLASFGPDDFEDETVITWKRTFDRDPNSTCTGRAYTYVALKAGGRWWITGYHGERGLAYHELVEEHLQHADEDSINIVAKWAVFA